MLLVYFVTDTISCKTQAAFVPMIAAGTRLTILVGKLFTTNDIK